LNGLEASRWDRTHQLQKVTSEILRTLRFLAETFVRADTTTTADRRAIVRQLAERVVVTRRGTTEVIDVVIHWVGGSESRQEVHQGLRRYDRLGDYARASAY
jgi:hypothetical protein